MWRRGGTAFERVGGLSTVVTVVESLYEKVAADPDLAPYFHSTNMPLQRDKLVGMISEALGGPRSPWMTGLVEAHRGRGITHEHYDRMVGYLLGSLAEQDVPRREVRLVARWLAAGREAVVDEPPG